MNTATTNVQDLGAKGDGVALTAVSVVAGETTFTQPGLTALDVGKTIVIDGAGAGGAPLLAVITAVAGGTVTLNAAAAVTVARAAGSYGTDDSVAVAAAMAAAAASGGGTVVLPPGTYLLRAPLTLPSNVHLRGAGRSATVLDFSAYDAASNPPPAGPVVSATGALGPPAFPSQNVAQGATQIVFNADPKLAPGDRALLGSAEAWKGLPVAVFGHPGEWVTVRSVSGSGPGPFTVALESATYGAYTASLAQLVPAARLVNDAGVHDLTVRRSGQSAHPTGGIEFRYAQGVSVTNTRVLYCTEAGVKFRHGLNCLVSACSVENCFYSGTGTSHGISWRDGCQDGRAVNNYLFRCTQAIAIGKDSDYGIPRMIVCEGNTGEQMDLPADSIGAPLFEFQACTQFISYLGNTARCQLNSPAFGAGGYDSVVANNVSYGDGMVIGGQVAAFSLTGPGIDFRTNCLVDGNQIAVPAGAVIPGITVYTSGCSLIGNRLTCLSKDASAAAIAIQSYGRATTRPVLDTIVRGNQILGGQSYGIYVDSAQRARIEGNVLRNVITYGIFVQPVSTIPSANIDIVGNTIVDDAPTPVTVQGIVSLAGAPESSNIFYDNNSISLTMVGSVPINVPSAHVGSRRSSGLSLDGHVDCAGAAKAGVAPGPAAGAGAAASVAGSDTRGTITLTTGTTGTGAGNLAVLAFNTGYPAAPVVVLTPANADAAGLQTYVSAELSQLTVNGRTPPAPSTQYQWTYHVIG